MQLTDEQIMHHFEMCEDPDGARCMECLYESENNIDCFQKLRHDVVCVYNRQKAEIDRLKTEPYQFADIGKMYSEVRAEVIKEFVAKLNEAITKIYNKHIFGDNDLNDEEKDAIINFSDDVTYELEKLKKEIVGDD